MRTRLSDRRRAGTSGAIAADGEEQRSRERDLDPGGTQEDPAEDVARPMGTGADPAEADETRDDAGEHGRDDPQPARATDDERDDEARDDDDPDGVPAGIARDRAERLDLVRRRGPRAIDDHLQELGRDLAREADHHGDRVEPPSPRRGQQE